MSATFIFTMVLLLASVVAGYIAVRINLHNKKVQELIDSLTNSEFDALLKITSTAVVYDKTDLVQHSLIQKGAARVNNNHLVLTHIGASAFGL